VEWLELESASGARERLAVRFDAPLAPAPLAVLYLHGFGSTQSGEKAELFRARALARGWAFGSFDFRGHGASEGTMRELTFSRNLADAAAARAFLFRRGFERVALFGSSMGGAVALWHAALEPAGVVATAQIAPALGMGAGMERWAGPERLARWRREGEVLFDGKLAAAVLGWELMDDLRRYGAAELAARHRTPTVIFQGQRDDSVDWRDVAAFAAAAVPGTVELRLYPEGDHRLLDRKEELWATAAALFERSL
jgi:pimeloyl-ACP methyl ester carboxylesterase